MAVRDGHCDECMSSHASKAANWGGSFFETQKAHDDFARYLRALKTANPDYTYGVDEGRDYLKLWRRYLSQDSRSIVAFVDARANLYQATSWKKRGRMYGPIAGRTVAQRQIR
jgi:hypothetical protein